MHYPPFGVLANVLVQSAKLEEAAGWSAVLGKWFEKTAPEGVRVLGPCTAPIARIKGVYRFHLILKATSRQGAQRGSARNAGAGGRRSDSTQESDCGRGCVAADVDKTDTPDHSS
jgi:primosomal protein N'